MPFMRRVKYYLIMLCRLHDSPKSVAGGFTFGAITHFYPTCGFGALFAVALAGLFETNLAAATLAWALTMPLFPFFFYLNFVVGCIFVAPGDATILLEEIPQMGWKSVFLLGKAFLIGSLINGIIATVIIWWAGHFILKRYRKKILQIVCTVL